MADTVVTVIGVAVVLLAVVVFFFWWLSHEVAADMQRLARRSALDRILDPPSTSVSGTQYAPGQLAQHTPGRNDREVIDNLVGTETYDADTGRE